MSDREKTDEIKEYWNDYYSEWNPLFDEMSTDDKIYVGDQWNIEPVRDLKNRPQISINIVKKHVDVQSGFERQNRTDVKAFPIEGGDVDVADIHSQNIKWIIGDLGFHQQLSIANKDAFIMGLGWYHPYMDFSEDMEDGNIKIMRIDPFQIMYDPYSVNPDLSDCRRLMRWAYVEKDVLKMNYPDKAADIERMQGTGELTQKFQQKNYSQRDRKRLNVIEMWHKQPVAVKRYHDLTTGESFDFDSDEGDIVRQMGLPKDQFRVITRQVDKMFLRIVAEDELLLFDGPNPYEIDMFPFIPVFGYYTPGTTELKWRFQGLVRALKDLQLEKNKRRSQLMDTALSLPYGLITILEGAGIKVDKLFQPGPKVLTVRSHDDIKEWQRNAFDQAIYKLEELFTKDVDMVGSGPDLLGHSGGEGGSAASAPGISLQIRQRQGMTAIQEIYDNIGHAKKQLGKYIIALTNKHSSRQKLEKIIGENLPGVKKMKELNERYAAMAEQVEQMPPEAQEQAQQEVGQVRQEMMKTMEAIEDLWTRFDNSRENAKFDTKVDEIQTSATYKIAIGEQLMALAHQGVDVPIPVLMEHMDLSETVKDLWKKILQEQAQAAQEAEAKKVDQEMKTEMLKSNTQLEQARISKGDQDGNSNYDGS